MTEQALSMVMRIGQLASSKKLDILGKFSVVTMPTNVDNEIGDILQLECDIRQLILQVIGGLEPRNIALITNDVAHAENVADKLMKGIEEADQEMAEYVHTPPKQFNKPRSKR